VTETIQIASDEDFDRLPPEDQKQMLSGMVDFIAVQVARHALSRDSALEGLEAVNNDMRQIIDAIHAESRKLH
jgi:hypothetical protein